MRRTILFLLFLSSTFLISTAQNRSFDLNILQTEEAVRVDGMLEEAVWQQAEISSPFLNKWPLDSGYAEAKTEVRLAYDDQFLYVAAVCYEERDYVIQTLKRDQQLFDSDGFSVVLDPVNGKTIAVK